MDQEDNQHSNCSSFSSKINKKQIIETTLKEATVINQKKPPKKQRLKRQLDEKTLPQETKEKSQQRKSSRLRSQPGKDHNTFIPQSEKIKESLISETTLRLIKVIFIELRSF